MRQFEPIRELYSAATLSVFSSVASGRKLLGVVGCEETEDTGTNHGTCRGGRRTRQLPSIRRLILRIQPESQSSARPVLRRCRPQYAPSPQPAGCSRIRHAVVHQTPRRAPGWRERAHPISPHFTPRCHISLHFSSGVPISVETSRPVGFSRPATSFSRSRRRHRRRRCPHLIAAGSRRYRLPPPSVFVIIHRAPGGSV